MTKHDNTRVKLEIIKGDIISQPDISAIVNAANAKLKTGGGVAGAIHRAAGPDLEDECRPLAPISPGEAVITSGHKLPNRYIIHSLGPVYGADEPSDKLLANCYRNALALADNNEIDSVAFPAISAGAFGYPLKEAAEIAIKTIKATIPSLENVRLVRMVLFSDKDLEAFKKAAADN